MTTKKIKELDIPVDKQSGSYTATMSFSTPSPGFVYVQLTDQDGNELWRELITESPVTLEAGFSHTNLTKLILNRFESNAHAVTSYIFELYWSLPPIDICDYIDSAGWDNMVNNHLLALYYKFIGLDALAETTRLKIPIDKRPTSLPDPITNNYLLGTYYYFIGLKNLGNTKTLCGY